MTFDVVDIASPDLVSETSVAAERIEARLVGCAEAVNHDDLTQYLDAVRRAAISTKAREVVLDVRSLEFMSAGCLRSLVAWLGDGQRVPECPVRVVWDPMQPWQRRSLRNILSPQGEPVAMV